MTNLQTKCEINYKVSLKLLDDLRKKGVINDVQYAQINKLNIESFSPQLAKLYA